MFNAKIPGVLLRVSLSPPRGGFRPKAALTPCAQRLIAEQILTFTVLPSLSPLCAHGSSL